MGVGGVLSHSLCTLRECLYCARYIACIFPHRWNCSCQRHSLRLYHSLHHWSSHWSTAADAQERLWWRVLFESCSQQGWCQTMCQVSVHNYIWWATAAVRVIQYHFCPRLKDPSSGLCLSVCTNQPAVVLYTGNYLDTPHTGVCLETQNFPDAINQVGLCYGLA